MRCFVRHERWLLVLGLVTALAVPAAAKTRAAVATEHRAAADAGIEVMRAGGNAVDAAVAAAAAVCVIHGSSCGVGGGGFALVHLATGRDAALDYRERAPAHATLDRYLADGKPVPERTRAGGLAVAVPGEVAGWVALHERFGVLPLTGVLAPAIRLARDGFVLGTTPHLRKQIERAMPMLQADPGLRAVFLTAEGRVPADDARIVQPDLARTLEAVAADGPPAFYEGRTAAALAEAVAAHGGILDAADLRAYKPMWREPLTGTFRGRRIVTFPPPGSGGVVLEVLGLLAAGGMPEAPPASAPTLHLLASALAQGFADRARWYGDADVPVAALLAPARLEKLRAGMSPDHRNATTADVIADAGTAHVSVVDGEGNAVAITTTINLPFGAGFTAPGTGIILNDEMDDFALAPDVPNVFGLTGAKANALAPGKRPQSSMCPTIVLDGKRPELVVGASGGAMIISAVVQVVLGVSAFGRDLPSAVAAPRIHDQGMPAVLLVESGITEDVRAELAKRGHTVTPMSGIAAASAAGVRADGVPVAAGDERKDGGSAVLE